MKCLLCRKNMDYLYKKIFNVSIYECKECGITYIDNKSETEKLKLIYDFDAYKENEGRLTKRLDKFADTIVSYKESGSVLEIGAGFGLFSSILLKKAIMN